MWERTTVGAPPAIGGAQLLHDDGIVAHWAGFDPAGVPVTVLVVHPRAVTDPRTAHRVLGLLSDLRLSGGPVLVGSGPQGIWALAGRSPGLPGLAAVLPELHRAVAGGSVPRRRSRWVTAVGIAATVLVIAVSGAVIGVSAVGVTDDGRAMVLPAGRDAPEPDGPLPVLDESAPPVSVVGPTFEPDASLITFEYPGFPFAFPGDRRVDLRERGELPPRRSGPGVC